VVVPKKAMQKTGSHTLLIILLILTFPIWIGLLGGIFGLAAGFFGLVIGLFAGAVGLLAGLIGGIVGGIAEFFSWIIGDDYWKPHYPFVFFNPAALFFIALLIAVIWKARKHTHQRK
jgi:hypothetical protein